MLTDEQERYLAELADRGLAEIAEADVRNKQILLDVAVDAARQEKRAELEAEAAQLIDAGLADFEANVVPTIKPEG